MEVRITILGEGQSIQTSPFFVGNNYPYWKKRMEIFIQSMDLDDEKGESINEMFERFTNILRGLKALEKDFPNTQLVKKILYSLPKSWRPKVTNMKDDRNLNDFKLDEHIGSFLTYEITLRHENEREELKK
ncbi:Uncharacterized protein TCM_003782 [Theobroma cacao]|uniref:DUF4219 domain-containing protein n=1 Tax=Theobroma cacao TaxID=3641 RepID=A0A061DNJ1_THECC|nr:Uncharacterized protein TCM_003782 [Theobroma cacao]